MKWNKYINLMAVLQTNYMKTKQIQIRSNSSCTLHIKTICS